MKFKEKKALKSNIREKNAIPSIYGKIRLMNDNDEVLGIIVTSWDTYMPATYSERGDVLPLQTEVTIKGYIPYEN